MIAPKQAKALQAFTQQLVDRFAPDRIILFGSQARGDAIPRQASGPDPRNAEGLPSQFPPRPSVTWAANGSAWLECSFHAQQCVEKLLKARLIQLGQPIQKVMIWVLYRASSPVSIPTGSGTRRISATSQVVQ